jgi:hypothetical protein
MASDRHESGLSWVSKLTMASALADQDPPVVLQDPEYFSDLQFLLRLGGGSEISLRLVGQHPGGRRQDLAEFRRSLDAAHHARPLTRGFLAVFVFFTFSGLSSA